MNMQMTITRWSIAVAMLVALAAPAGATDLHSFAVAQGRELLQLVEARNRPAIVEEAMRLQQLALGGRLPTQDAARLHQATLHALRGDWRGAEILLRWQELPPNWRSPRAARRPATRGPSRVQRPLPAVAPVAPARQPVPRLN